VGAARRILAAAAVSAAAACSLLVDTNGLSGADDAGADAILAPPPPNPPPASADGAPDAPGARVCDATFCDDFDDGSLGARWTSVNVDNGAMLTLDDAGLSPPFALGVHLPTRATTSPSRAAQLVKRFSPFPQKLLCTAQIFVQGGVTSGEGYGLFIARPSPNGGPWSFEVKIHPTNTIQSEEAYALPDGGKTLQTTKLSTIAVGAWVALAIELDWPTQAIVTVAGSSSTIPFASGPESTDEGGATALDVGLGEDSDGDLPAFDALFDDFACTLTP
jgi:hypothetical protein